MSNESSRAADNLHYVCELLEQLKVLAGADGGPFLRYLIDMALKEASDRLVMVLSDPATSAAPYGTSETLPPE
ncbi:hypothetical protein [Aureimonas sp. Leaf454]|uniref:hypothetical protein n=1 Tax=Aureimonas sp. Leaf454 TaxID=1736381 RepID=UPI0012E34E77|nr:hypothetical protein [Aureimonas sp. Leaf454]